MKKATKKEATMRHSLISKTLSAAALIALIGCGGGGSDGNTDGGNGSQTQSIKKFQGAATVGDYAVFSFNPNTLDLNYSVSGFVFTPPQSGSLTLTQLFENFYKTSTTPTVYMMISNNIAIGKIPTSAPSNPYAYIIGVSNPSLPTVADVSPKTYIYTHIDGSGNVTLHKLFINSNQQFTATNLETNATINGCWKIDSGIIKAQKNGLYPNCSTYNGTSPDYNVMVRPGSSRAGVVVDYTGGNGIGIGLEQKPLNLNGIAGTYHSYYYENSAESFAKAIITTNNIEWYNCPGGACPINPTFTGSLQLNQDCLGNQIDGVACATVAGNTFLVFLDNADSYYVAVSTGSTPFHVEVGAK